MSETNPPLPLPPTANLHWLKNRVSDRLRELRLIDPTAQRATALRDIAKSYGYPSWTKLKAAVEMSTDERNLDAFRDAVHRHDAVTVERLLSRHELIRAKINAAIFGFDSPAVVAASGDRGVVDVLLRYGADINLKSTWWAGGFGVLDRADLATGEFLISRGARVDVFAAANLEKLDDMRRLLDTDPALVHARGGDGGTPLHFAKSIAMIDLLLERGVDIDARDRDHEATAAQWLMPPLPNAGRADSRAEQIELVRHLAKRGTVVDVFMAAALDDAAVLSRAFDTYLNVMDYRVGDNHVPLCPAAPGKHQYVYTLSAGTTVLDVAAAYRSVECLKLIADRGSPRDRLLLACATGNRSEVEAIRRDDPSIIKRLTSIDQHRLPAAAWAGRQQAMLLMLDAGFDPAVVSPDHGTILHAAAWHGRAKMIAAAMEHPAVKPMLDTIVAAVEPEHQSTAMGWCCHGSRHCRNPRGDYGETSKLLMGAGAPPPTELSEVSDAVRAAVIAYAK